MSISAREFQVNLFSNTDGYEQKLSSFTNILNPPLYLNPELNWHVGISNLGLPKFMENSKSVIESSDVVVLNQQSKSAYKAQAIWTIEDFAQYLVHVCEHPNIYTNTYFRTYLLDYNFEINRWKNINKEDIIPSTGATSVCSFQFDLKELLEPEESMDFFLPQFAALTAQRAYFKKAVIEFNSAHSYRLVEVLNTCIRHLLVKLKIDGKQTGKFSNLIKEHFEQKIFLEHSSSFRRNIHRISELITRFIRKLVKNIQEHSSTILKMSIAELDVNYVFFYCSIVKETYIGDKRGRVMLILPYNQVTSSNSFTFSNVLFNPIEMSSIDEIHILITDEYGRRIKFHDSFCPTFICLTFKAMPLENKS